MKNGISTAQGVSNVFGSMFGIFPASGSLPRSSLNDRSGAKSQLASLVTSCIVLLTILLLLPAFRYLPSAVMAAIVGKLRILFALLFFFSSFVALIFWACRFPQKLDLVKAAIGLWEFEELIFLWKIRSWRDLALSILTFVLTLVLGVEGGITISVIVSILFIIRHTSMPHIGKAFPSHPSLTPFSFLCPLISTIGKNSDYETVGRFEQV
jgi:MFS superfamily sulfate permease-like transporter